MNLKIFFELLKETFKEWQEDKASRLAAALAYYTAFSIAPLLIIVIAIAAVFFGEQAAQGQIVERIQNLVGREGAEAIQTMIQNSRKPTTGTIATIISIGVLLFGATNVFAQLQDALNTIWEVAPKPGVKGLVKTRFISFTLILGVGFLLLVSLVLSTVLAVLGNYLGDLFPNLQLIWSVVNFTISFGIITLLFALIYKFLPDVKITWGDVGIGAAITALLFTIGKSLLGLYLANSSVGSTYGAAGSFVVLLLWVNYSAQILLFGAEFTQVYANKYGSQIVPDSHAIPLTEEARTQQGIPHNKTLKTAEESDKNKLEATATHQTKLHQQKRNPAAIVLAGLIEIYQGVNHLVRGKSSQRKKRK
ncbi:MAG: YihY/virulence factor BrkB family protein [Coleofasciculaceae cyanobacterium]